MAGSVSLHVVAGILNKYAPLDAVSTPFDLKDYDTIDKQGRPTPDGMISAVEAEKVGLVPHLEQARDNIHNTIIKKSILSVAIPVLSFAVLFLRAKGMLSAQRSTELFLDTMGLTSLKMSRAAVAFGLNTLKTSSLFSHTNLGLGTVYLSFKGLQKVKKDRESYEDVSRILDRSNTPFLPVAQIDSTQISLRIPNSALISD
jgi:hypothetical protein